MSNRQAPKHLSLATRRWFRKVLDEYQLEDHHVRLLTAAGEAWDRMEQARKMLATDGIVQTDRFGQQKAHPAIAIERDCRIAFARCLRELDLDGDPAPDPRPSRPLGRRHA